MVLNMLKLKNRWLLFSTCNYNLFEMYGDLIIYPLWLATQQLHLYSFYLIVDMYICKFWYRFGVHNSVYM